MTLQLPRPLSADPRAIYQAYALACDLLERQLNTLTLGTPQTITQSFNIPTGYIYHQLFRLTLSGLMRATLAGTGRLVLSDDFGTRSRIVLLGPGA